MARPKDAIGALMALNRERQPLVRLHRLSAKLARARLDPSVLDEQTSVDPQGRVTRTIGLCAHCEGTCCQSLRVPVGRADVRRIAAYLGRRTASIPLAPVTGEEDADEGIVGYLAAGPFHPCPFFDGGCTIHVARPEVCRSFGLFECIELETFVPTAALTRGRSSRRDR